MASSKTTRKLTAILCADVVEYSRLREAALWLAVPILTALFLLGALALPGWAWALDHGRPVNIGALTTSWGPTPVVVGLRDGLVALGYRENEHFAIGTRFVSGNLAELPGAAQELVEAGVDIIFALTTASAKAAQRVTRRVPVVFVVEDDPVMAFLVGSFSRPGGSLTGVTGDHTSLGPKRLEIFKSMIPGLKKVMFVYDGRHSGSVMQASAYRGAASLMGIDLVEHTVRTESEAEAAFARVEKGQVDGILVPYILSMNIPAIAAKAATEKKIPAMFPATFWIERGGLASYAPNAYSMGEQAARLVEKIMRGVSPADIPVEVNNDIEFAVDLKTAKALGIKIPPEVLYQANQIVR